MSCQWKGVDKHSRRVSQTQVGTSVTNRGDIDMTVVGVARQRVERHSEHQTGRRHIQLLAELLHLGIIERSDYLGNMTVRLTGRKVVGNFRTALAFLHHFGEIGLGFLILLATLSLSLLLRELE